MNLRVTASTWASTWAVLNRSFTHPEASEWGVIGLLGLSRNNCRPALLVGEVLTPDVDDFREQGRFGLSFDRSYIRRAILRARERILQGLITFHTHPGCDEHVDFSEFDDREDPLLMENLHELMPGSIHASIVVGRRSLKGRAWFPDGTRVALDEIIVVGDHLVVRPLTGAPAPPPPPPTAVFDRALVITGAGALARLSRMRIAVVGASGTGSVLAELLVRAGAGHITLIDPDLVKPENLNRILHATAEDARLERLKVHVLKRALESLGLPTEIEAWSKDIVDAGVARELAGFDVLIGGLDRHWPRLVLNEVTRNYLIPLIDVGTEIGTSEGSVDACTARASYVTADRPCLICSGVIDPNELGVESLAADERKRVAALQYGTRLAQPAVMDLNARASSYGALILRHMVQPMLREPLPVHVLESLLTFGVNPVSDCDRDPLCLVCGEASVVGQGDAGRLSTRPSPTHAR